MYKLEETVLSHFYDKIVSSTIFGVGTKFPSAALCIKHKAMDSVIS